jgi:hypothetical protein
MPRNFYLPLSIFCLTVFYREERSQGENPLRLSFAICSPAALSAMKAGANFPSKLAILMPLAVCLVSGSSRLIIRIFYFACA